MRQERFLLIDDDPDDRDFFKEALKKVLPGAELISFSDGPEAVEWITGCAQDNLPVAIVMDYNMPHMNAPQLLDRLCEIKWLDKVPKIVWSTAAQPEYFDNCKNKGAIEYFTKPSTQDGLLWIAEQVVAFTR